MAYRGTPKEDAIRDGSSHGTSHHLLDARNATSGRLKCGERHSLKFFLYNNGCGSVAFGLLAFDAVDQMMLGKCHGSSSASTLLCAPTAYNTKTVHTYVLGWGNLGKKLVGVVVRAVTV